MRVEGVVPMEEKVNWRKLTDVKTKKKEETLHAPKEHLLGKITKLKGDAVLNKGRVGDPWKSLKGEVEKEPCRGGTGDREVQKRGIIRHGEN